MRFPGLIDVHVHLRTPGGEHKEDFRTGSAAALAGGFTTLLAMPNTQPPLVSTTEWTIAQTRAKQESLCDVFLFAGASEEHIDALPELAQRACGLKIYLNDTYGPLRVDSIDAMKKIVQAWPPSKTIAFHAEDDSLAAAINMAAQYQRHIHICHVSRKSEIEKIADAKARGLPVTCEVTPHHLFLTEADAVRLGTLGDMRPRLASQSDVDALWDHINSTVDCVASDHAPHTLEEKGLTVEDENKPSEKNTPPGVPGLESTLPLLLTAANEGRLSYERVLELLYTNPRRIYHLPEQPETWIEVDPDASYTFPDHSLYTKCGWSPFTGRRMTGRVLEVIFKGRTVYKDGKVLPF
jgi:carbamoyl-phosphate synthase/aspartate carbamoyltransferase/dihydroorotase